jgi:hypothetical protein
MGLGVKQKLRGVVTDLYEGISWWKISIKARHGLESWPKIKLFAGMCLPVTNPRKAACLLPSSKPGFLFPIHPPWSRELSRGPFRALSSLKCRRLCLVDDSCRLTTRNRLFSSCCLKLAGFRVLCLGVLCFGNGGSLDPPLLVLLLLTPNFHWTCRIFLVFRRVLLGERILGWGRWTSYPKNIHKVWVYSGGWGKTGLWSLFWPVLWSSFVRFIVATFSWGRPHTLSTSLWLEKPHRTCLFRVSEWVRNLSKSTVCLLLGRSCVFVRLSVWQVLNG